MDSHKSNVIFINHFDYWIFIVRIIDMHKLGVSLVRIMDITSSNYGYPLIITDIHK